MILYLETNFILSIATGRDVEAVELLQSNQYSSVRLAIPAICYMEALVAFEEDRKRRKNFRDLLNAEIKQARRDRRATAISSKIAALEQSGIAYDDLLNEVEGRFLNAVQLMADRVEIIQLNSGNLIAGLTNRIFTQERQRRDNFVLQCILSHAQQNLQEIKVLLTDDLAFWQATEVDTQAARQALLSAGVERSFSRSIDFIGWLDNQTFS